MSDPHDENVRPGVPSRPDLTDDDYAPHFRRGIDPVRQRIRDEEQLRVLAILYYVFGGLSALCSSFFIMYVVLGALMAAGAMGPGGGEDRVVGDFMLPIAAAVVLGGWAFSAFVIYAGRCLARRQRYRFCFVMACLCCANVPLGTVLGVFTIIVLARPGVKALFTGVASGPQPAAEE